MAAIFLLPVSVHLNATFFSKLNCYSLKFCVDWWYYINAHFNRHEATNTQEAYTAYIWNDLYLHIYEGSH